MVGGFPKLASTACGTHALTAQTAGGAGGAVSVADAAASVEVAVNARVRLVGHARAVRSNTSATCATSVVGTRAKTGLARAEIGVSWV